MTTDDEAAKEKQAKAKRAMARLKSERADLRAYLRELAQAFRRGDDEGAFCAMLAWEDKPTFDSSGWHLKLAQEIEELLECEYAPFEPDAPRAQRGPTATRGPSA